MASKVSVTWELAEIRNAIEAGRILADLLDQDGLPDKYSAHVAPRTIAAVLNLATTRLDQVRSVLRRDTEAEAIRTAHNVVDANMVDDQTNQDLLLDLNRADRQS